MRYEISLTLLPFIFGSFHAFAQQVGDKEAVEKVATASKPVKLEHAEPLYIDLIRDLGARKGEKEWNVGTGMTNGRDFDSYELLVEYEWAQWDRFGLELEVPVTIYSAQPLEDRNSMNGEQPSNRVESLKMAFQWTFLVAPAIHTSVAIGAITELELTDLNSISWSKPLQGMLYNPFLIAAKKWGQNLHSLIYTGPRITDEFGHGLRFAYEINSSFHYMIPTTRNFVGLEINKEFSESGTEVVLRPQMRVTIKDNLMVGIVPGIPIMSDNSRMSTFLRLIYEPRHRH